MIFTVSFVGSGNVASHLAKALFAAGVNIHQICSKSLKNASELAQQVEAMPCDSLSNLQPVDLLIVSVPDDLIANIYEQLSDFKALITHTSGSTGILQTSERSGYFYPLQSFRKEQTLGISKTPFFVDATLESDKEMLLHLAEKITTNAKILPPEQKEKLHLAAVFVNNYVNHLFGLTNEFLSKNELNFTDLEPIIQTTIARAMQANPYDIQTGPALRNDDKTLAHHKKLLVNFPEMKAVYELLAESIQNKHHESDY